MTCLSSADDTAILFKNKEINELQETVTATMLQVSDWFSANFLSLNVSKTYTQHYTTRSLEFKIDVKLNNEIVEENEHVKYLGVFIDKSLKFTKHISYICGIISRNIGIIARTRYYIDKKTAHLLYNCLVLPHLSYCCMIWGINYESQLNKLFILQKRAVRLIEHVYPPNSSEPIFKMYNLLKLNDIARSQLLLVMHKFITGQLPKVFDKLYNLHPTNNLNTRQIQHLIQPFSNRNYRLFTSGCLGPKLWNDLMPPLFTLLNDIPTSKRIIKNIIRKHFIEGYNGQTS